MKIVKSTVELLDFMGDDLAVVNAARVSFNSESNWLFDDDDIKCTFLSTKDSKLIDYLAKNKHWSPFAHTSIRFRIKAPIFVARQLVKHQVGLVWNEVSRRYIDTEPEFYFPKEWRGKPTNSKQGSTGVFNSNQLDYNLDMWSRTICVNALDLYQKCIKEGLCPEQARMILPQNTMTEWIWTGSLLAFNRVCKLRLDSHAQKETQEIAQKISDLIFPLFPESWEALMKY
jgi:thymidylate synthase (FAD)